MAMSEFKQKCLQGDIFQLFYTIWASKQQQAGNMGTTVT
jgi:hypothetical protein